MDENINLNNNNTDYDSILAEMIQNEEFGNMLGNTNSIINTFLNPFNQNIQYPFINISQGNIDEYLNTNSSERELNLDEEELEEDNSENLNNYAETDNSNNSQNIVLENNNSQNIVLENNNSQNIVLENNNSQNIVLENNVNENNIVNIDQLHLDSFEHELENLNSNSQNNNSSSFNRFYQSLIDVAREGQNAFQDNSNLLLVKFMIVYLEDQIMKG